MNELIAFDQTLFTLLNGTWTNPVFDSVMPILTDLHKEPLFAFVLLPLVLGFWIYKQRALALKCLLMMAVAFALSDMISYRLIKPAFNRDRPAAAGVPTVLRTEPHSGRSFPSNHAANNFAAAVILSFCVPAGWLFFFLAALIAYSRVYVGVHFPLDVTAGALVGLACGTTVWMVGRRWVTPAERAQIKTPA